MKFNQWLTECMFTISLRAMHYRNQIIIDGAFVDINDPWNRGGDPLGDIESAIDKFRDDTNNPGPITIGVMCGSPVLSNIIEMFDSIDNVKLVVIDDPHDFGTLPERQRDLLLVNNEFLGLLESIQLDGRRYMTERDLGVILVEPNNKPWYQDRKLNRSKKSRRKL